MSCFTYAQSSAAMSMLTRIASLSSMKMGIHLFIWILIYGVYTWILSLQGGLLFYMKMNAVQIPLFMIAYYVLRYVQLPYLFHRDKKILFTISILGSSLVLYCTFRLAWIYGLSDLADRYTYPFFVSGGHFLVMALRFYSPAMVLIALEDYYQVRKERDRIHVLEKEKIANELKFLKAQINPHFLFNTLNNLYSYVVTSSPKAPEMVLQMSGILDYVFNKSRLKSVSLKEEVDTIEHFIRLEQVRYGDRLQVEFNREGNMIVQISPLILLSIVENAFKHGASGDIDTPEIKILIQGEDNSVYCEVWNTKNKYNGDLNDAYKEGIGLSNIKQQLKLIYPGQHDLNIQNLENTFSVSLKIKQTVCVK